MKLSLIALALFATACGIQPGDPGPEGPAGKDGVPGTDGSQGPKGDTGASATVTPADPAAGRIWNHLRQETRTFEAGILPELSITCADTIPLVLGSCESDAHLTIDRPSNVDAAFQPHGWTCGAPVSNSPVKITVYIVCAEPR